MHNPSNKAVEGQVARAVKDALDALQAVVNSHAYETTHWNHIFINETAPVAMDKDQFTALIKACCSSHTDRPNYNPNLNPTQMQMQMQMQMEMQIQIQIQIQTLPLNLTQLHCNYPHYIF